MMGYGDGMGLWGMWGVLLFGGLLLAGLVLLVVLLVRLLGGGTRPDRGAPPPYGPQGGAPWPGGPAGAPPGGPAGAPPGGPAGAPWPEPGVTHARQILAERYARGEIDTEEYQARLRTLGES